MNNKIKAKLVMSHYIRKYVRYNYEEISEYMINNTKLQNNHFWEFEEEEDEVVSKVEYNVNNILYLSVFHNDLSEHDKTVLDFEGNKDSNMLVELDLGEPVYLRGVCLRKYQFINSEFMPLYENETGLVYFINKRAIVSLRRI